MAEVAFNNKRKKLGQESTPVSFAASQLILFNSRKKWGIIYALATVAGVFCVPTGVLAMVMETDISTFLSRTLPLPVASFLVILGMYVLNDLIDADLDRANHKKRPIPTAQVSKKQAWIFVVFTNLAGMILVTLTFNPASIAAISGVIVIGLMYSAPRISLKDRFVIKTLAIALALVLCAIMGATISFGLDFNKSGNSIVPIYTALMLGMMVFITSPFNDLGDISGDQAVKRRTIPIVIGPKNTVKMAILLAISMSAVSWILYGISEIEPAMSAFVSLISVLVIANMAKTLKKLDDIGFVRKQHRRSLLWHIMLQLAIIVGSLLV
jgi:4-hydroxybenzoate polyprenyltransferase